MSTSIATSLDGAESNAGGSRARRFGRRLGAFALALCAGAVWAQAAPAPEALLQGPQLTESALVQRLALPAEADAGPAASEAAGGRVRRGFRPPVPPNVGRANVLITFVTDSAELSAEGRSAADVIAGAFRNKELASLHFRVEGHADARGTPARNLALSRERARSVVDYLVQRHGIAQDRLVAEGRGSAEPLNRERVDAPENRRVTFVSVRP